ncbi:MAG TPA: CHAP domain-containing protein [Candidatus Saccharimonadia bacterium]|jgi:surface antigen/peptidoglycan hydrolase CwlO-like protein
MLDKHHFRTVTNTLSLVVVLLFSSAPALADQFDDQIANLKQQAAAQSNQAAQLHAQADDYRSKVAELQAEIGALQAQINYNQAKYSQVTDSIAQNQAQLDQQKTVLAATIKSLYLDSTVTPLEMLASSNNFSDFLDEQQYQDKVKQKIQDAMTQIEALQRTLESQQTQLTNILADQHSQHQQLSDTQNQMNQLLAVAETNAAAADQQVKDSNAKIANLRAQQAAAIAAASRHVNFVGRSGGAGGACDIGQGNGGYPSAWCNASQDSMVDSWGMYTRECVSYAAWAATDRGHNVPYGLGNANQWPSGARARGIAVDGNPEVGNVAIWMGGYYGHAMIVEKVVGSDVIVSSMNADDAGHFRYDEWSISSLEFIHFR